MKDDRLKVDKSEKKEIKKQQRKGKKMVFIYVCDSV